MARRRRTTTEPPRYLPARVTRDAHDLLRQEVARVNRDMPDSLTAAGERVLNGQATYLRRLNMPWQARAFGYYDILGEIKFAAQFYARSLMNLRLYIATVDDGGELTPVEPDSNDAADRCALDALRRIRDPGGTSRSGLQAAYGRLMFITGEALLLVTRNPITDLEQWEMLSADELRLDDGVYTRYGAPSLPATQFRPVPDDEWVVVGYREDMVESGNPRERERIAEARAENSGLPPAMAYRLWRRHPRFSEQADSTMMGVLELCEELVLLTQAVRARAKSRLAGSGVLFLDDRISPNPLEPVPDEDPLNDPFVANLTEAMTAPILDEGTAAAVVPLVVRVTVPEGMKLTDLVYHLQIIDPMQVYPEEGLRRECIRRIATGLDMPAEILEGIGQANHWSAWAVDEQSWKAHLMPVAEQLVADLTAAYLTPYLKQEGVEHWASYVIAYDAAAIINHPDRFRDAKDAYDRRAIGKSALREAGGFQDEDAPTEPELAEMVGIAVNDADLAWTGEPGEPSGNGGPPPPTDDDEGARGGADVEKGPPQTSTDEHLPETVLGSNHADMLAALAEGVARMALLRAREAAGSRIRTAVARDDEAVRLIDGVPNSEVAATLGSTRVRHLLGGSKEQQLVGSARPLVLSALPGISDDVVVQIADTVERHAARTLYEPRATLNGTFHGYVRGLLRVGS